MAQYEFNGQQIEAPDDMAPDDIVKLVSAQGTGAEPATQTASPSQGEVSPTTPVSATAPGHAYAPTEGTPYDADMAKSKDWLAASRITYKAQSGKDWTGSDEDLAQIGLNTMGFFNYNLPTMAVDAATLAQSTPEQKEAFLYMMESYDKMGYSWNGTWRAIKGMALDPTSYVGLGTFGLGAAAGSAVKIASKEAFKEMLKLGVQTGIEGGFQAAAQATIRQQAEINAGGRKDFNMAEIAGHTALGAAGGVILGGGASAVGTAFRKEAPWSRFSREQASRIVKGEPEVAKAAEDATQAAEKAVGEAKPGEATVAPGETAKPATDAPSEQVKPGEAQVEPGKPVVNADGTVNELEKVRTPETATPEPRPASDIMEAVKAVSADSGVRIFPATREATTEAATKATKLLSELKPEEVGAAVEQLRREATTPEQAQVLANTFKEATDKLEAQSSDLYGRMMAATDATTKDALFKELEQAKAVRDAVKAGDTVLSSMDGRILGDRVGAFNTGLNRELSEANIMAAHGIKPEDATAEQKAWAANEYFSRYEGWVAKVQNAKDVADADNAIAKAYAEGDIAQALKLSSDKQAIVDKAVRDEMTNAGMLTQTQNVANKGLKYLNEALISTVFTTSTLVVNTVPSVIKTIYRPALDYMVRGVADYAAMRQMTATYSAMAHSTGVAWQAAVAAFKYEKALLSTEPNKLLEGDAMFGGIGGRTLRFFPRMLGATDEFFGQMNYRGYVTGQAMSDSIERATKLGMKGDALEAYVTREVTEAQAHMFADKIDAPHVIDFLRQKALDRGLKGDAGDEWIKLQLDKNEDLFKVALSQSGKDYSDDLLFKRKFSGDNTVSRWAQGYEKFVNENPWMRIVGQMFFKTPVRVFEEGLRLTPVVQFMVPGMMDSLLGKKGQAAQVRAQGEMLLSYSIATWAMSQYAQGKLKSSGPTDYKQRRGLENGGDWQQNSYVTDGGTQYSYRNMDPFSTPLKIVANVLDRYQDLSYRQAQGEFVDHDMDKAKAWMGVAVGSIASAVSDANLVDGASQLIKLGQALMDPEHKDMTIQRFLASKAQLVVPNQYSKIVQNVGDDQPDMNDPVTISQYIRSRINPADPYVPKQYDALGQARTLANPMGALTGINSANTEQLARGNTERELAVLKEISNLEIASGSNIGVAPAKVDEFGQKGIDLRTVYSKVDPSKTLYDRWMEKYAELPVTEALHGALVANKAGSVGTRKQDGVRVEMAKEIIKSFRDAAMTRLYAEESGMKEDYIKSVREKANAQAGSKDVPFLPYR